MLLPLFHPSPHITLAYWKISESRQELLQLYSPNEEDLHFFQRFSEQKQLHFLATRILCAKLFPGLDISKDEYGKPHLDTPNLHLSWSHSGSYAALISDKRHSTGIDIELVSERILRIEPKFCNETDRKSLTGTHRMEELLLIWGAKEAMYKWYGKKEVDFKKHMTVAPFMLKDNDKLLGKFHLPGLQVDFKLGYDFFDGHVAVWIENKV